MKKKYILSFLLVFCQLIAFSQPTPAELEKMMKDAQDLMKNMGVANTGSVSTSDPGSYGNVDNWKFPAKNLVKLGQLPKKSFSKTELTTFLNNIYSLLSKKLSPNILASVQSIASSFNNDGNKMGDAAVVGWYEDHEEEALLLIVKAAVNNPDNGVLLNNCAALLTMSGIGEKAIPILKYIQSSYPNDAMVQNNLAQAYAGLGELDTAMVYFGSCLKLMPEHPEACNTVAHIEASRGNVDKAVEYFEKSIKSAYSKTAGLKLKKLKQGSKIAPLIRPRIKLPDYFNLFKYQLPEQCISTETAAFADAEHKAFRAMITKQAQKYGSMYGALAQDQMTKAMQIMNNNGAARPLKKTEFMAHPFWELCGIMAGETLSEYTKAVSELNSTVMKKFAADLKTLNTEYDTKLKTINLGFEARGKDCGEGKAVNCPTDEEMCNARNGLANQYLPKFAALTEDFQKKCLIVYQRYFDELVYWHYLNLQPLKENHFRMKYYQFIMEYLTMIGGVAQTKIIRPCEFNPVTASKDSNSIDEAECPLEIEIPFIVGKFELDCEKIAFSGGEGAVFKYEKNFKTKQSTLSVGIGANLEIGKINVGPVEVKAGVSVSETLFITFDGDNKVSDFGLKFGAKAAAGAEVKGEKEIVPKKSVEVKRELTKREAGVGYTLGVNSGWNFNEGPFKGLLD